MTWKHVEDDGEHSHWKCTCCGRRGVTASPTVAPTPCVCTPMPQPKRRDMKGLKR